MHTIRPSYYVVVVAAVVVGAWLDLEEHAIISPRGVVVVVQEEKVMRV